MTARLLPRSGGFSERPIRDPSGIGRNRIGTAGILCRPDRAESLCDSYYRFHEGVSTIYGRRARGHGEGPSPVSGGAKGSLRGHLGGAGRPCCSSSSEGCEEGKGRGAEAQGERAVAAVDDASKVTHKRSPAVIIRRERPCQGAQERGWLVRLRSARTRLRREILPGTGSLLLPFGARLRGACFGRVSRWVRTSEPGLGHARPAVRRLWGGEDRPSASKKPSWLWTSLVGVENSESLFLQGECH